MLIFGHTQINWSNVNILESDQFYMKGKHKLHIICNLYLNIS